MRLGGTLGTQIKARPPLAGPELGQADPDPAHHWLGTFNRSNNLMGSLLWYYRACWHQNLAQIAFGSRFTAASSRRTSPVGGPLTISARGHWIVFAPAASLGHESRLSGFLCGIGPQSPAPVVGTVVHYTTVYLIGPWAMRRPYGRGRRGIMPPAATRGLPAVSRRYPPPALTFPRY